MPEIANINHIGITVTDLERSTSWYTDVLGLAPLMEEQHPDGQGNAVVLGKPDFSMCVGLHAHDGNRRERFSEESTGLDHISFLVPNRAELAEWESRLVELGVEHSPINDRGAYPALVFRDPDNIQLEFFSFS